MAVKRIYGIYPVVYDSLTIPASGERETQNVPLGAFREKIITLSYSMTYQCLGQ